MSRCDWHRAPEWEALLAERSSLYAMARAMNMLGHNLAIVGALFEAARRARIRCPECGEEPCDGRHPGLVGPCCVCCPASPVEPSTETPTGADVPP